MYSVSSGAAGALAIRVIADALCFAQAIIVDAWLTVKIARTALPDLLKTNFLLPMADMEVALYREWSWEGKSSQKRRDGRRVNMSAQWLPGRAASCESTAIQIDSHTVGRCSADAFCTSLVEHCGDAIVATGLGGIITLWNRSMERLFGGTASEIIGKSIFNLFSPTSISYETAQLEGVKQGRAFSYREAVRFRKDGRRATCSVSLSPIISSSGRVVGAAEVARHFTAPRQEQTVSALFRRFYRTDLQQRAALARNVHDHAGQYIAGLALGLKAIERHASSPEEFALLSRLRQQLDELSIELHRVVMELRPAAPTSLGLRSALQTVLDDWTGRTQIAVNHKFEEFDVELPPEVETTLFRIVQEGLSNVARHAVGATKVEVLLSRSETEIRLIVRDDGQGPPAAGKDGSLSLIERGKFGLAGMQERVALVGGRFEAVGVPGAGTTLSATIPFAERPS
jgi:PAS domain S-box-containing protein